ncbi:unnamed protein product [Chironomus riparius]|uniref:Ionotropic glutamate receptor C-terminal domain-containing protein n=1 Tax=Chironomus riparius TaxID=315576 RepID=A0A9N9S786_9DIPT|nr:unnamed protein product [Chironomus riparius]
MNHEFKILLILALLADFKVSKCTAGLSPYKVNPNVTAVAQVLHDIAIEFLLEAKTHYRLTNFNKFNKFYNNKLYFSQFIFLNSLIDFGETERRFLGLRFMGQSIKYFIFIPDLSFEELKTSWIFGKYQQISFTSEGIFHSSYFVTTEMDTVTLSSIESFEPATCGYPNLKILNTFNKRTSKWTSKLENHEKFLQYNGCELVFALPTFMPDGTLYHVYGYSVINKNNTNFSVHGITPKIFEIASMAYNFTVMYQPVFMDPLWIFPETRKQLFIYKFNQSFKFPSVYFEIQDIQMISFTMAISNAVVNTKTFMFVTPADKYTAYEKFVLPFDSLTWILLGTTFMLTFMSIMMINLTSKATRNLVYGHKVTNPIWNVISIFFGISQTKLPTKNFSRFILVLFIFFCLIFRTCFQSKFFEFMTSEPRLSPPRTISDLIDRNYSVYQSFHQPEICSNEGRLEPWPNVTNMYIQTLADAIQSQSQNSTAKMALCVDEFLLNHLERHNQKNYDWNKLDSAIYLKTEAFMFRNYSFYYKMFIKVINDLISTGIMEYLVTKFYTKKLTFKTIDDTRKVLGVNDLLFGFKIWLVFCIVSGCAFGVEQVTRFRKIPQKIKFAKINVMENCEEPGLDGCCELSLALLSQFRVQTRESLAEVISDPSGTKDDEIKVKI